MLDVHLKLYPIIDIFMELELLKNVTNVRQYDWLAREISKDFADKAIICRRSDKKMYSSPDCILVDDNAENIDNWEDEGGIGILHFATQNTIGKLEEIFRVYEN